MAFRIVRKGMEQSLSRVGILKPLLTSNPILRVLTNDMLQCTLNEEVVIEYAPMDVQLGRKPMYIQYNWIATKKDLENEHLLLAFGMCIKIDRRKLLLTNLFTVISFEYLTTNLGFIGIAKEELIKKNSDLMEKLSVMIFADWADKRPADKTLLIPPKVL